VLHTNDRFHDSIERAVTRIEEGTDSELIVVAAPRSGSYRDVSFAAASVGALLTLLVLLLVPYDIDPWWMPLDLVLSWLFFAWVFSGRWILRWIVPAGRQRRQVEEAAHAEFHREIVHATPHRTGVLVYVSALEGRVEVLADLGVEGQIPAAVWSDAIGGFVHDDLETFLAGLDRLGEALVEHIPALETDLVDLPNAPRVRR
jgi:putative membrane protein